MPKLIAILAAVLVGAVVALGLCQVLDGREGVDFADNRAIVDEGALVEVQVKTLDDAAEK